MDNRIIIESEIDVVDNRIITESEIDAIIYETIAKKFLEDVNFGFRPFKDMAGRDIKGGIDSNPDKPTTLEKQLGSIRELAVQGEIKKIGIIYDSDNRQTERLQSINTAIKKVFEQENIIREENKLFELNLAETTFQIGCYLVKDNLDELLISIATNVESRHYANCLDAWETCLKTKEIQISKQDFDKHWLNNYIRYDTCSKKEGTHREKNCSLKQFSTLLEKGIFDIQSEKLNGLKVFFNLFKRGIS